MLVKTIYVNRLKYNSNDSDFTIPLNRNYEDISKFVIRNVIALVAVQSLFNKRHHQFKSLFNKMHKQLKFFINKRLENAPMERKAFV